MTHCQLLLANNIIYCQGACDLMHLKQLNQQIKQLKLAKTPVAIDGSQLTKLDSAGALLLIQLANTHQAKLQGFTEAQQSLLDLIAKQKVDKQQLAEPPTANLLHQLGQKTVTACDSGLHYLNLLGELTVTLLHSLAKPAQFRWREIAGTLEAGGYTALPIIGLLSFLIGVVLAYQMGLQLQTYGANIFIVNFLSLAILREFGPLLTAIIVAGRTGSAFTAQLGMMKINEEIDALRTMGISPIKLLILPRIIGMLIALPLLSVWADIFGILGGMLMAKSMLDIPVADFLKRFQEVTLLKTYVIGLIKTPVFALIIASIGCYQGLQVSGSAESVGRLTTKSVVQAIFFIIVADAFFSILFSWLNI